MRVLIVTPRAPVAHSGNETTRDRWREILVRLGHSVTLAERYAGEECDLLVALHAVKSGASIRRFRDAHPARPLVLALTGTDVYGDPADRPALLESVQAATRVVVLQPLALAELPEAARARTRVIHQSVPPIPRPAPAPRASFDVCVLAHLRPVKDPFRAALASRLLPPASRIRILQVGGATDDASAARARREEEENPRYRWLGNLPRPEALAVLAASDALVCSSTREGGANAVGEALVAGVPVLASRIPGNLGLLGEDHPALFPAGDERALAELLRRVEADALLREALTARARALAPRFEPAREEQAFRELLSDLRGPNLLS